MDTSNQTMSVPVYFEDLEAHRGGTFHGKMILSSTGFEDYSSVKLNSTAYDWEGYGETLGEVWSQVVEEGDLDKIELVAHEMYHAWEFYEQLSDGGSPKLDEGMPTAYGKFMKNYVCLGELEPEERIKLALDYTYRELEWKARNLRYDCLDGPEREVYRKYVEDYVKPAYEVVKAMRDDYLLNVDSTPAAFPGSDTNGTSRMSSFTPLAYLPGGDTTTSGLSP